MQKTRLIPIPKRRQTSPTCNRCGIELQVPLKDECFVDEMSDFHLCPACYQLIADAFDGLGW